MSLNTKQTNKICDPSKYSDHPGHHASSEHQSDQSLWCACKGKLRTHGQFHGNNKDSDQPVHVIKIQCSVLSLLKAGVDKAAKLTGTVAKSVASLTADPRVAS